MRVCKYCKKPIQDKDVWNLDREGNGYHHSCLCEMEFRSRDRQIYDKGKADVLDKIRAEATSLKISYTDHDKDTYRRGINDVLKIIDTHILAGSGKEEKR